MNPVKKRYYDGTYLQANPDWGSDESLWKAGLVRDILARQNIQPASICDVGCGAGVVLRELQRTFPDAELTGYDIAPALVDFWSKHEDTKISFHAEDFLAHDGRTYDVILMMDVVEHLQDPLGFLSQIRQRAKYVVLHIPLDLDAVSVFREKGLLYVREKTGHVHYFTRKLALAVLEDSGLEIIEDYFTDAYRTAPGLSVKSKLAGLIRRAVFAFAPQAGPRLLGGQTLMVLARGAEE